MARVKNKKATTAKVYSLPADYLRRSRYTAFLQKQSNNVLICWYIGPETGRLFGVYWSSSGGQEHLKFIAYKISDKGSFKYDDHDEYDNLDELLSLLRKKPEAYYTEHMNYIVCGIGNPPKKKACCKIIPFSKTA